MLRSPHGHAVLVTAMMIVLSACHELFGPGTEGSIMVTLDPPTLDVTVENRTDSPIWVHGDWELDRRLDSGWQGVRRTITSWPSGVSLDNLRKIDSGNRETFQVLDLDQPLETGEYRLRMWFLDGRGRVVSSDRVIGAQFRIE